VDEGGTVAEDGSAHEELSMNATLIECSLGTYDEDGIVMISSTDKEYDPDCSYVLAESARNTSPGELLSFPRRPVGCSDFVSHLELHGWMNIPGTPSRGPRYSE
jgi:hypothetical protein